ncbi:MAG: transposase [Gemmataceae bacterium]
MTGILEHDQAIALLQQATRSPQQGADCSQHLHHFRQRYLPCFQRTEQRHNAAVVLHGKLSDLQRKTSEPIAYQAGRQRKPLQAFVGWAPWHDEAVMAELRRHVRDAWSDADAVFVVDGSGFAKKGHASCGVGRGVGVAWVASVRCRGFGSMPGRRGSRRHAGSVCRSVPARKAPWKWRCCPHACRRGPMDGPSGLPNA